MKKTTSLMPLSLAALLSFQMLLSSCGSASEPAETLPAAGQTAAAQTEEQIDYASLTLLERLQIDHDAVSDDLPEMDLGGEEIIVHCTRGVEVAGPDEQTGDILDDVMYLRNAEIEERFNCKLTNHHMESSDYGDYVAKMNKFFLSGDDVIDLMYVWNTTASTFASQGFLTDLTALPYIDFEKPWFYKEATQRLSYKNHTFVSVDLLGGYSLYSALNCVFFNKDIAADYQLENLYDVVRDDRWTFDYVRGITKDLYSDLNGNNEVDIGEDLFGYEIRLNQFSYEGIPAMGLYIIGKDADDMPYLAPSTNIERFEKIYTALRDYIKDSKSVAYSVWTGENNFANGNYLLSSGDLKGMNGYRNVNFNIGILPQYKFDESQEKYYSSFIPDPSAIPSTCATPERSALILSAYAAGGFKKAAVPYFETVVKNKYTTDEDSAEMLNIMASNVTTDGTIMFTDALIYTFLNFADGNKEFSSFWASQEKSAQKFLDKLVASLDETLGL